MPQVKNEDLLCMIPAAATSQCFEFVTGLNSGDMYQSYHTVP